MADWMLIPPSTARVAKRLSSLARKRTARATSPTRDRSKAAAVSARALLPQAVVEPDPAFDAISPEATLGVPSRDVNRRV